MIQVPQVVRMVRGSLDPAVRDAVQSLVTVSMLYLPRKCVRVGGIPRGLAMCYWRPRASGIPLTREFWRDVCREQSSERQAAQSSDRGKSENRGHGLQRNASFVTLIVHVADDRLRAFANDEHRRSTTTSTTTSTGSSE